MGYSHMFCILEPHKFWPELLAHCETFSILSFICKMVEISTLGLQEGVQEETYLNQSLDHCGHSMKSHLQQVKFFYSPAWASFFLAIGFLKTYFSSPTFRVLQNNGSHS